jgi:hypothetical protein
VLVEHVAVHGWPTRQLEGGHEYQVKMTAERVAHIGSWQTTVVVGTGCSVMAGMARMLGINL